MGRLQRKVKECEYKKYDRLVIEQFINWLGDEGMISEVLREVLTLKDMEDTTGETVLLRIQRVEVQRYRK